MHSLRKLCKNFYVGQVPFILRDDFGEDISYVWKCVVMIFPWYPFSRFYFKENKEYNMSLLNGFFAAILDLGIGK